MEPKDSLWKRMMAKMMSLRGQHEQAARTIRDAWVLDPKNGDIVKEYFDILEAGKFWDQLKTETTNLIKGDKSIEEKGWWVYVKRAVALRNTDKKQEAMADFNKAFDIVVKDKDLNQDVLISIIDKMREHLGVQAAIDRVSVLAQGTGAVPTRWKIVLAYLYHQAGDNDKASENIEEARRQAAMLDERNQATALNIAGTIYMMSGQYERAKTAYEELLVKRPEELAALNNLAFIMAEHIQPPNLPKAMELSNRAFDLMSRKNSQDASVLDTIGWVNVLSGGNNVDRGIEHLWNSIKINEIPEAHYHLGEAFLLKKATEEAKRSLKRASDMITEREEKKQPVDPQLKQRIEAALIKAEKASIEPRAGGNP
jgi:tetratricopeptide (TPR) repeat protein